jgi:hypothetical protein
MTHVYIVCRNEGEDLDVFANEELATEWAKVVGSKVEEESIIGREMREMMKGH